MHFFKRTNPQIQPWAHVEDCVVYVHCNQKMKRDKNTKNKEEWPLIETNAHAYQQLHNHNID